MSAGISQIPSGQWAQTFAQEGPVAARELSGRIVGKYSSMSTVLNSLQARIPELIAASGKSKNAQETLDSQLSWEVMGLIDHVDQKIQKYGADSFSVYMDADGIPCHKGNPKVSKEVNCRAKGEEGVTLDDFPKYQNRFSSKEAKESFLIDKRNHYMRLSEGADLFLSLIPKSDPAFETLEFLKTAAKTGASKWSERVESEVFGRVVSKGCERNQSELIPRSERKEGEPLVLTEAKKSELTRMLRQVTQILEWKKQRTPSELSIGDVRIRSLDPQTQKVLKELDADAKAVTMLLPMIQLDVTIDPNGVGGNSEFRFHIHYDDTVFEELDSECQGFGKDFYYAIMKRMGLFETSDLSPKLRLMELFLNTFEGELDGLKKGEASFKKVETRRHERNGFDGSNLLGPFDALPSILLKVLWDNESVQKKDLAEMLEKACLDHIHAHMIRYSSFYPSPDQVAQSRMPLLIAMGPMGNFTSASAALSLASISSSTAHAAMIAVRERQERPKKPDESSCIIA